MVREHYDYKFKHSGVRYAKIKVAFTWQRNFAAAEGIENSILQGSTQPHEPWVSFLFHDFAFHIF